MSSEELQARLPWVETIRDAGKTVLVVDYVDDGSQSGENLQRIHDFRTAAANDGFLPYAALRDRSLDEIVPQLQ